MRKLGGLFAVVAFAGTSAAMTTSASAQYKWDGFYAGVNGGGAWGNSDVSTRTFYSPTGYFSTSSPAAIANASAQTSSSRDIFVGGTIGYNIQSGNLVSGLEADVNYLGFKGSTSGSGVYPCCAPTTLSVNSSVKADWLMTLRSRFGVVAGNWLFYGTGGLALTRLKGDFVFSDAFANANESGSFNTTKAGWTIGGGTEVSLGGNWTAKAEYLHIDFGHSSTGSTNLIAYTPGIPFPSNSFVHDATFRDNILRTGINYKY